MVLFPKISVRHLSRNVLLRDKVEFLFLSLLVASSFVFLIFRYQEPGMKIIFVCFAALMLFSLVEVVGFDRLLGGRLAFWTFSLAGFLFIVDRVQNDISRDITASVVFFWMSIVMKILLGMAVIYRTYLGLERKKAVRGPDWPRKLFEHEVEFFLLALHTLSWLSMCLCFPEISEIIGSILILYASWGIVFFLLIQVVFLRRLSWARVAFVLSEIKLCGFILISIFLPLVGWFLQAWKGSSTDFLSLTFSGLFVLGEEVISLSVVEGTCLRMEETMVRHGDIFQY